MTLAIRQGGDRRSSRRLAVSTGSGSVDRWIVRGKPALHGQPSRRVADHGVGLPRRAADGLTFFKLSHYYLFGWPYHVRKSRI